MGDTPAAHPRIAKYLADCGVASRRKAEELVAGGDVALNGEIIHDLGRRIRVGEDRVEVRGTLVQPSSRHLTLAHHKPLEVLVTRSDTRGRRTVYDLLPPRLKKEGGRLRYAGRLDFLSTGLLILTTDGDLAHKLVHPRHHVRKIYEVVTNRVLHETELQGLAEGVRLEDGMTAPAQVRFLDNKKDVGPRYEVVLREGRNRQVRRMIEAVGARVARLHRASIGGLSLHDLSLARGEFRLLDEKQIAALFAGAEDS